MAFPALTPARVRGQPIFFALHSALLVAVFVLAVAVRSRLPPQPFIDGDVWGYLHPALSKLTGGGFQHTDGRDFLYPGFVYLLLRVCGDFRAIPVAQHALGVLTGGLLLLAWHRACRLLRGTPGVPPFLSLAGLLVAATYLSARSAISAEHTVRPEAIFPFFALLSIWLNLEFIHRRWVQRQPRVAIWLGAAAMVVSVALYLLKPSFGFAVGFANAPVLLSLCQPGMSWRRQTAVAGGALAFSLLCLILPERALRRGDPQAATFLPNTLLTIHADQIRDQLGEDLASGRPLPYPREWLSALHERLGTLLAVSARPENRPYSSLGFNPDYLLYTDYVFKPLIPSGPAGERLGAEVSFALYRRAALHHPGRMLGKVLRQLGIFYHFESFRPRHLLDTRDPYRGAKELPIAQSYRENAQLLSELQTRDALARYAPARTFATESGRLSSSPKKISQRPFFSVAQNVLGTLYFPGLLGCLAVAAWRLASRAGRARWLLPTGVMGLVYSYNFGNNLTVAVVHSLDVDRYVSNQLAFTLLASAVGWLYLGGAAAEAVRRFVKSVPASPFPVSPGAVFLAGAPPGSRVAGGGETPSLCVLIPCYNEVESIPGVVREYRAAFPHARLLVVDNASVDGTAAAAAAAGAEVLFEGRQGKARAVLSALSEIDTDLVVMVDGDGSYPAEGAVRLVRGYLDQPADLLTGVRSHSESAANSFRPLHQGGTRVFGRIHQLVFGFEPADLFSGLRLFSRRFYQNVPILSRGFELELELTVQAIDKGFSMRELPIPFGQRTEGTVSKLRTVRDGLRILRFLVVLARDYRPLAFFGVIAAGFFGLSLLAGFLPVWEFIQTHYVSHVPLAVLAASLMILAFLSFQTGLVLESGLRYNREAYQHRIRQAAGRRQSRSPGQEERAGPAPQNPGR